MRLLNSSNLQLQDFPANKIPDYAILSHTWGDYEVSFADLEKGGAEGKAGYRKIRRSCCQPVAQRLGYIWIDTCCIDKSSSAELSEAINSMHSWYKGAKICYAYLADVPTTLGTEIEKAAFATSRWFKRGWTLQELIGPSDVMFFSREWIEIGTKSSLCEEIAAITGISVNILTGNASLESASIAKRMSWASHRSTTRKEDVAYCLMGLFDVNMPLLYGEGEKAFIRLQEEIIKHSDDQSLFAWADSTAAADHQCGLLASSPTQFATSGSFVPYSEWGPSAPFSISNKGLRIELPLSHYEEDLYLAALDCPVPPEYEKFLGIYLKRVFTGNHQYVRVKPHALCSIGSRGNIQTVYVRNFVVKLQHIYPVHAFQLRKGPTEDDGYKFIKAISYSSDQVPMPILTSQRWPPGRRPCTFMISKGSSRLAGIILLERHDDERLIIMLGSTMDFGVGFEIASMSDDTGLKKLQESFRPQAPGAHMILRNHQVRVSVDPQIHNGNKYYMVDIHVEAIYHAPYPIDVIREIIPGLQTQSDGRPPNATVTSSRRFGKFKLPFSSSRI